MRVRAWSAMLAIALPLAALGAPPVAKAVLRDAGGKAIGTATFSPAEGGVAVHVTVTGLTPGKHGIHIHAIGKCTPPDFQSAGGHFNPFLRHHGLDSPDGAHAGDLPNLSIRADGSGTADFTARGASLGEGKGSLLGPDGTALVIHAGEDDGKTDPAGNAGPRVACGVIERS